VPVLRASKELKRLYKFSSRDDLLKGEVKADESYF